MILNYYIASHSIYIQYLPSFTSQVFKPVIWRATWHTHRDTPIKQLMEDDIEKGPEIARNGREIMLWQAKHLKNHDRVVSLEMDTIRQREIQTSKEQQCTYMQDYGWRKALVDTSTWFPGLSYHRLGLLVGPR